MNNETKAFVEKVAEELQHSPVSLGQFTGHCARLLRIVQEQDTEITKIRFVAEERIALLGEMLSSSFSDGRFIFDQWIGYVRETKHRPMATSRFVSYATPDASSLVDSRVYLPYGEFTKDVACESKGAP